MIYEFSVSDGQPGPVPAVGLHHVAAPSACHRTAAGRQRPGRARTRGPGRAQYSPAALSPRPPDSDDRTRGPGAGDSRGAAG
eukprot:652397-Hanusia_phi.AAC.1